jgi:phospholipase C
MLSSAALAAGIGLAGCGGGSPGTPQDLVSTATPIKHLVVIYGENVSFDHYFGTYPNATNPTGEPAFTGSTNSTVNGLTSALMTNNPNFLNALNAPGNVEPFRLDPAQAATADQNHAYSAEQQAYDNGLMDLFPLYTGTASSGGVGSFYTKGQVMGYYDGNTVTALWNYAQHFAMSDNAYTDTFGPSTPGALAAISGQTNGVHPVITPTGYGSSTVAAPTYFVNDGQGGYTDIGDADPAYDVCSSTALTFQMTGRNIGDLLNASGVTWGGFMGGFNLSTVNANQTTGCARATTSQVTNTAKADYYPHHAWFQYYASTANPTHARPSSVLAIGSSKETDGITAEPANHQYDVNDFYAAVEAGNYPSVSFLKAPSFQDGHAGYSDPLDEQAFVAQVVNFLQQQPDWQNTAVIVTYDDSDGWYDHQYATPTSASYSAADQLNGNGVCGTGTAPNGVGGQPVNGRCGPGTRIPFIVISPWAKSNYVGHGQITQVSITRFIEDNWLGGQRIGGGSFDATAGSINDLFNFSSNSGTRLYVDPTHGTVLSAPPAGSATPTAL